MGKLKDKPLFSFQNVLVPELLLISQFSHVGKRKPINEPWSYFRYPGEEALIKQVIRKGKTDQNPRVKRSMEKCTLIPLERKCGGESR